MTESAPLEGEDLDMRTDRLFDAYERSAMEELIIRLSNGTIAEETDPDKFIKDYIKRKAVERYWPDKSEVYMMFLDTSEQ